MFYTNVIMLYVNIIIVYANVIMFYANIIVFGTNFILFYINVIMFYTNVIMLYTNVIMFYTNVIMCKTEDSYISVMLRPLKYARNQNLADIFNIFLQTEFILNVINNSAKRLKLVAAKRHKIMCNTSYKQNTLNVLTFPVNVITMLQES